MKRAFFIGLGLGQISDYTAWAVVERAVRPRSAERRASRPQEELRLGPHRQGVFDGYRLRHLRRFRLGTPYREIAQSVRSLQEAPQLKGFRNYVVADTTGVGLPVFEMLEEEGVSKLHGITLTGGDSPARNGRIWRVPKRDLVSTAQVLLQNRTLKFAQGLPEARTLRTELQNFKMKINIAAARDAYEHWREGDHDDMVLSLAMACWFGENAEPDDWSGVQGVW